MPLDDTHYLAKRSFAYGLSGLAIGASATVAAISALVAESVFCHHRPSRDRQGFKVVGIGELVSAVAQAGMGINYVLIQYYDADLELFSEIFNAIYIVGIIFTTATILQTSYRRWLDLHELRVGGIRPLDSRHWTLVIVLTIFAAVGITANKVVYLSLLSDDSFSSGSPNSSNASVQLNNNTVKDGVGGMSRMRINLALHTATLVLMGVIWLVVFFASSIYNIRVLKIAHTRQKTAKTRETTKSLMKATSSASDTPNRSLASSLRKLIWLRLTIFVYNVASIFFVLKVVDSIVLTEFNPFYERHATVLNLVAITNHILQTATILLFPLVWLFFCTHFYFDLSRYCRRRAYANEQNATTFAELSLIN